MYRREKDRAHQLRLWRRFVKLRSGSSWGGVGLWGKQTGRFRKGSGLGCPSGRKCGICKGYPEMTRQERRSNTNFEEWKEEYMSGFK